eukprot:m.77813 g.77813  ORF g.77813 m.77813 type:complete len:93 (-) comp19139_c0_seq3:40-318(-)
MCVCRATLGQRVSWEVGLIEGNVVQCVYCIRMCTGVSMALSPTVLSTALVVIFTKQKSRNPAPHLNVSTFTMVGGAPMPAVPPAADMMCVAL